MLLVLVHAHLNSFVEMYRMFCCLDATLKCWPLSNLLVGKNQSKTRQLKAEKRNEALVYHPSQKFRNVPTILDETKAAKSKRIARHGRRC